MSDLLKIVDATYLHDRVIHMRFNNNKEYDVDLSPMLENDRIGIFEPLLDNEFFKSFKVDYTLCWGDDIDVAPEYFFFLANKANTKYKQLFTEWGYLDEQ